MKTGTDGQHHPNNTNPKYGVGETNMCSEFVSWYLCNAGVKLYLPSGEIEDFRDIISTDEAKDAFEEAFLLYDYYPETKKWINNAAHSYTPQAGDWLMRMENEELNIAKHSMILLRYDEEYERAFVINGPWPVTLHVLKIHDNEVDNGHEYYIGRIP